MSRRNREDSHMEKIEKQLITIVSEPSVTPKDDPTATFTGYEDLCIGCGYPVEWCQCFAG
jgi:hypothetical protein